MSFSMTIGAQHDALIQLLLDSFPTTGVTFAGNTEILLCWIRVMEIESFNTSIVTAAFAFPASISHGHQADFPSPLTNGLYQILPPISILPLLASCQLPPPFPRLRHSRMLYQLSYRGIKDQIKRAIIAGRGMVFYLVGAFQTSAGTFHHQ